MNKTVTRKSIVTLGTIDPEWTSIEKELERRLRAFQEAGDTFQTAESVLGRTRRALGETLCEAHDKLAKHGTGTWTKFLDDKGINRMTAHRIMEDFRRVADLGPSPAVEEAASELGIDLAERKYSEGLQAHREELKTATELPAARQLVAIIRQDKKQQSAIRTPEQRVEDSYQKLLLRTQKHVASLIQEDKIKHLKRLVREALTGQPELDIVFPAQRKESGKVVEIA